ncbi:MAG TPA: hypothetical protein VFB16_14695 [Bauldia sp.]|nr:hypothetical protein [Bauldia sp.]
MKTIRLTDSTYQALAAAAEFEFRSTGERQPDGTWLVALEDDTYERLDSHRFAGESGVGVVLRVLNACQGRRPN